jgi:hypothetical protein
MIFGLIGIEGLLLALLGFAPTTALAAILVLTMGMSNGYINILAITWLQKRTDEQMLGRMMSLVMFASLGLQPLSNALAGVVVEIDIVAMFVVAGVLLAGISWISAISPTARTIGVEQAEIVGQ